MLYISRTNEVYLLLFKKIVYKLLVNNWKIKLTVTVDTTSDRRPCGGNAILGQGPETYP